MCDHVHLRHNLSLSAHFALAQIQRKNRIKKKKTRKSQPKESSKYFSIKLHFSKEFIEVAAVHWSNGKPAVVAASHTFCEDCLL